MTEFGLRYADDPREWRRQYAREYRQGLRRGRKRKRSVLLRLLKRTNTAPGEPLATPEKIERLGWCWPWYGALNNDGYGVIQGDGKALVLVHRVALAAALDRPIKRGLFACHKCNVRHCVRPAHLYEGTKVENEADKHDRGWVLQAAPVYGAEVAV
jgi:hypothetical protein